MGFDMNYLRTIHGAVGASSALDARIREEKRRIERELMGSINLEPDATRNGVKQRFVVVPREEAYKYEVIAFPDEPLVPGDLLEFRGRKWMVTDVPSVDVLQKTGIVWECNHCFRFQNFDSTIIERWGVLDSGNYTTDVKTGLQIGAADSQYKMYMQYDDDTAKIFVDKRFAVGKMYDQHGKQILDVYQVTRVDPVSRSYGGGHLLVLRAKSNAYNPKTDNFDEMICNYIAPDGNGSTASPSQDESHGSCEIFGRDTIKAGLGERMYTATFRTSDGVEDHDVPCTWTVEVDRDVQVAWKADGHALCMSADASCVGAIVTLRATAKGYPVGVKQVEVTSLL